MLIVSNINRPVEGVDSDRARRAHKIERTSVATTDKSCSSSKGAQSLRAENNLELRRLPFRQLREAFL